MKGKLGSRASKPLAVKVCAESEVGNANGKVVDMAQSNNGTGYQSGTTAAPQRARQVLNTISPQVRGSFNDSAILVIGTGNAGVRYTAPVGVAGNSTTVAHVVAGANTALSVSVTGAAITVNLATNGSSVATSTAAQVVTAVNANGPASALVTASAVGDGTGVAVAGTATALTGGKSMFTGGVSNAPFPSQPPIHNTYAGQGTGGGGGSPPQPSRSNTGSGY